MTRRNWKKANPRTFGEAIEMCLDYAEQVHRRNADRVAEMAGEKSKWTVYGWAREENVPGRKILAFQHACGCDFITRYLAHSNDQLLVSIPSGRLPDGADVQKLQATLNAAVGSLLAFATGKADVDEVGHDLNLALESLAWHRENVHRAAQPELELCHE